MSEHPRRDKLEGFLLSSLSTRDVKSLVTHLLEGCDQCRDDMSPLATAMFTPDTTSPLGLSSEEDAAYDRSIATAFG
ncbi:MAG TPA: hypothetical protein VG477_05670, partial [Thermoanaerobaculia bacterium]|nr:hypothetical protein [Thermoanaerobaculia bacterium]